MGGWRGAKHLCVRNHFQTITVLGAHTLPTPTQTEDVSVHFSAGLFECVTARENEDFPVPDVRVLVAYYLQTHKQNLVCVRARV